MMRPYQIGNRRDRVAIFSHLFNNKEFDESDYFNGKISGSKSDLDTVGVYKSDDANKLSFYTKLPTGVEKDRNYIADYPLFTRIVIAKGNIFDIFDKRVDRGDCTIRCYGSKGSGFGF